MSRVDVAYGVEHRLKQACQTVYKHFLAGRKVWVYSSDAKRLAAFSKGLWEVESTAFVPHSYLGQEGEKVPVYLCDTLPDEALNQFVQAEGDTPWLLNLDLACPPDYHRFERILEIVSNHPEDKSLAKERIRMYKQHQQQVVYHNLGRN